MGLRHSRRRGAPIAPLAAMRHQRRVPRSGARDGPVWTLASHYVKALALAECLLDSSGQDLIEYAIVAALISLAATASMKGLAVLISNAFLHIGTKLSTYTS
jgi:pilus assembly protein Flp/PilA